MSNKLSTYFNNAVFTLFGSWENRGFNEKKSVLSNFNSMCSLSCFKRDSEATLELKKVIAENDFTYDKKKFNDDEWISYSGRERMIENRLEKIATIQTAIVRWKDARSVASTRQGLIRAFEQSLANFKKNLESYVDCSIDLSM